MFSNRYIIFLTGVKEWDDEIHKLSFAEKYKLFNDFIQPIREIYRKNNCAYKEPISFLSKYKTNWDKWQKYKLEVICEFDNTIA